MANVIQVSDVASGSFVIFFLLCSFQNRQDCQNDLCAYTMCWFQIPPLYVEYVNWLYLWTCFIVSIVCRCDGNMVSWVSIDLDAMEKLTFRFGNPCMISFRLQINCRFNCFGHSLKISAIEYWCCFALRKKKIEIIDELKLSIFTVTHFQKMQSDIAMNWWGRQRWIVHPGLRLALTRVGIWLEIFSTVFFLLCKDPHVMNLKSNVWFKIKNWKNV